MHIYVGRNESWVKVDCTSLNLVEEIIQKADSLLSEDKSSSFKKKFLLMANDGSLYQSSDNINNVLKDKQFVKLVVVNDELQNRSLSNGTEHIEKKTMILDGSSMTTEKLWKLSTGDYKIKVSSEAIKNVKQSRMVVDDIVAENRVVYGVTTGFGKFANVVIPSNELELLQKKLIQSHSAGVGDPLSIERTRMMFALRINVLCKGFSGISISNLEILVQAFNASCLPWIPEKGTVGASGDLAPLSHLANGLMGNGKMWSPSSGWSDAGLVLEAHNIKPLKLGPKEGIAMINGTQFICALGSEAVERAEYLALQADVVAALTVEALSGISRAFDEDIHKARPHPGQQEVAERLRKLLQYKGDQSEITKSHSDSSRVQDAYTLRCCPQVHGIAHDTIKFTKSVLNVELNSATDNPMVFCDRKETISGGNFHGEYPAKVLDYLAIGLHEIGSMSERRIERLNNPALSQFPAFLVKVGGLNCGYMIPHCTAAALVAENKCLCSPASTDSISTSAGQEDHVSMGGYAARKALKVVDNMEYIIAIELLCACQAIDFHRPLRSTKALEAVYKTVRDMVPYYETDRPHYKDIEVVARLLHENKIWEAVKSFINEPNMISNHC